MSSSSFRAGTSRLALPSTSARTLLPRTPALAGTLQADRLSASRLSLSTSSTAKESSRPASSPITSPPESGSSEPPTSSSKLLSGFAKLLGYNHNSATAIRSTNYYYDMIRDRHTKAEHKFWYEECGLPVSFTSWFHITNLHIYLLTVRFRALPSPLGRYFNQQLINHFFIDAEQRLQMHTNKSRIVSSTLKDCLEQYHGSFMAYDEAIVTQSDAVLAAALWRNVFAGAWAGSVSAEGKKAPVGHKFLQVSEAERELQQAELEKLGFPAVSPPATTAETNTDAAKDHPQDPLSAVVEQAQFAVSLEKLVEWVRRETQRLDQLPDRVVAAGKLADRVSPTLDFTSISSSTAS